MSGVFNENNIVLGAAFINKQQAIAAAGRILAEQGYVTEKYIEAMQERDKVVSVYIGNHVAIPHGIKGSENEIIKSGLSLLQVPAGVPFGEGEIAYIVIGIAGKGDEHMSYLSKIALICSEADNVEQLRVAQTKQEILDLFGNIAD